MADPAVERPLPHNLDAERAVLGAVLLHHETIHEALEVIDAEDFFRDAHRRIFDKMVKLLERGQAIDFITLKDELGRSADSTRWAGPPTWRPWSTACRTARTSGTTRASSRRRRPSGS